MSLRNIHGIKSTKIPHHLYNSNSTFILIFDSIHTSVKVKYTTLVPLKLTFQSLEIFSVRRLLYYFLVNKHFFRKINLRTGSNLQSLFICWSLLTSAHIIKLALHKADLSQNCGIKEVSLDFFSFIFILGSSDLVPSSDTHGFDAVISSSKFSFVLFNWTHSFTLEAVMPHLCLHLAGRRPTDYSSIAWLIMDHSHRITNYCPDSVWRKRCEWFENG